MPFQHSFWIIGETTLSVRCAEVLLGRGHTVRGLVTTNEVAVEWAGERGVEVVPFRHALQALTRTPYDYLLSIVNSRILGADILATPALGAINYHDGPLPRYAGMHSTSWAILNGETAHGVTWHGVAELVDAGPIFKQRIVPIDPDETALSLNAKSYEAALDSFIELTDDITAGRLAGREQDLSQRTYYPRLARPAAAGLIDWSRPSATISALVRALDFGVAYSNPLGRAKVRLGSRIYLCNRLRVTATLSTATPGSVVAVDHAGITVAAADREVVIESVAALDGSRVDLQDVAASEQLVAGGPVGTTPPAALERITARNGELAAHERYWRRTLRRTRVPEIPYRKPAGAPSGRYHRASVSVPAALTGADAGDQYVARHRSALVAGFAALLLRLTQEETLSLAVEHSGLRAELAELRQLFVPAVPIHLDLKRNAPFAEHMESSATQLADLQTRGTYARDLPARYPELAGRSALLPVLVRIDPATAPDDESAAELILDIDSGDRSAVIHADAGTVSADDTVRIGHQLETLLAAVAADPALPLGTAPIVPATERARLLADWNATAESYPHDATIHGLFEARVRSNPDLPAVHSSGTTLSFAELNARADCWARALESHGVGQNEIVGLRAGRSPELVVGMLAILKAGGAYLPLDLSLPAARTQFMLDDAGVRIVLTTRGLRDDFERGARTVLCLDEAPVAPGAPVSPAPPADAESLAYVIYTSGSTGTPKGVLVHHRGAVNYLSWAIRYYGATEGSGSPVHSPVAFDLTVTSLIAPLLGGRPVHLLDERLGVEALAGALRSAADLTLVKLTPSHLDLLRHQIEPGEAGGRTRAFVIGGENLQGPGLGFWQEHAPGTRLINEYGPTETVVGCCIYEVPPGAAIPGSVPIGRPIANTRLYVLDAGLQLLPIGIAGELFIGGDSVARGYLNRPELTAERFIPDPFRDGGGRLYRTGDRVRYLPDGNLEFLGRLDGQVKVRGYRIELGEIESVLASHPAVAEAAATVWRDPVAGPRLVGYVTLRGTGSPSGEELREWCARTLPEYMVPASFERLARLPLTGNGKVDRAALPAPTARTTALIAPRTALERQLVAIWSEVLGRPVGVTDNFFELGGHSLLAVQMISRVREATGHAPPLSVLLTRPTVENVAAALEGHDAPADDDDPLLLRITDGDMPVPFFFMHGDFGGSGFYVQTIARHLEPGQAMYSLRPYRPGGPISIEEMAAENLELIRSVQPHGPYMLGGNCNGGAVAYEVARQLRTQGEEVRLLALVNTSHRNAHLEPVRRISDAVARLRGLNQEWQRALYLRLRESVLRTMESRPYGPPDLAVPRRIIWWGAIAATTVWRVTRRLAAVRVARLLGRAAPAEEAPAPQMQDDLGITISDTDEVRRARYRYIDTAMRDYVARPSDLHVTLIWWSRTGSFLADPALHGDDVTRGWSSLCPVVQVAFLDDDPEMAPDLRLEVLGRALSDYVQASRPRAGGHQLAGSAP